MENTIINKLNLNKYKKIGIVNNKDKLTYFDSLNYHDNDKEKSFDCLIVFVYSLEEWYDKLHYYYDNNKIKDKGRIFFAYPKKNNKRYDKYIERDSIFSYLKVNEEDGYVKDTTYKFNKMVSLDDVYTIVGLANITNATKNNTLSQKVKDYEKHIPKVRKLLDKESLIIFDKLTPGYQRDWARYIFSAKTNQTKNKRVEQAVYILKKGYKSINLYQQNK